MVAEYFPGMHSRISGIGVSRHSRPRLSKRCTPKASAGDSVLPIGGFYKARATGETHAWEATAMHMLQAACDAGVLRDVAAAIRRR